MIGRAVRALVFERASHRCEYCLMPAAAYPGRTCHVEHVRPRQHGGADTPDNLALACDHCNYNKGANLTAVDPHNGNICLLFNPRNEAWETHFELKPTGMIVGITETGRATASLLKMNAAERLIVRARWTTTPPSESA